MTTPWTEEELSLVRTFYGNVSTVELQALLPNRGYNAIKGCANRLGIVTGKRKNWSKAENEILAQLYGRVSRKELMSNLPGRTNSAIEGQVHKLGIKSSRPWTTEEDALVAADYKQKDTSSIAFKLGRTIPSIHTRARILGVSDKRLSYDQEFFAKPNELNSYWAGFIAADGCIYEDPKNVVSISLSRKDKGHLERMAADTEYTGIVRDYVGGGCKSYTPNAEYSKLVYCGASRWVSDLQSNYNLSSRKTFTLSKPNISDRNALSYIAGLIDGDGSICYYQESDSIRFSITGTQMILNWVKSVFDEEFPDRSSSKGAANVHPSKSVFSYKLAGKRAYEILSHLAYLDLPLMQRKWSKLSLVTKTTCRGKGSS